LFGFLLLRHLGLLYIASPAIVEQLYGFLRTRDPVLWPVSGTCLVVIVTEDLIFFFFTYGCFASVVV
jgi:hypothetical protein